MKESNGLEDIISQAIEEMKSEQGNNFSLEKINLAELERRTGVSISKLRRLKSWYLYYSRNIAHYYGSKYAYDFVTQRSQKARMLAEPISKCFLEAGGIFEMTESMRQRQKAVLYNPKNPQI